MKGVRQALAKMEGKVINLSFDILYEIRARLVWREDPNHENIMTDGLTPEDGETSEDILERELDLANQEGLWIRAVEFFDPKSQTWHEVLSWDGFIGQDCQADDDLMAEAQDSTIYQKVVWDHLSCLA